MKILATHRVECHWGCNFVLLFMVLGSVMVIDKWPLILLFQDAEFNEIPL